MQNKMPALFLGHGSPMNAIEDNPFVMTLKKLSFTFKKPKAILVISAHWTTPYCAVNLHADDLLYDMYGFPRDLYMLTYPAKNADFLIPSLQQLIANLKIEKRALDHGSWSLLTHLYADADIPVMQLSINTKFSMQEHFELGKKLSSLREEGVLVLGSGNVTHNLREINFINKNAFTSAWAKEFDDFVKDAIEKRDFNKLINFEKLQRYAHLAHPTKEHYIPLLYVAAMAQEDEKSSFVYEGFEHANLSMRCWKVGD
jgi:4,5-DOPA dioxygenase extradiol